MGGNRFVTGCAVPSPGLGGGSDLHGSDRSSREIRRCNPRRQDCDYIGVDDSVDEDVGKHWKSCEATRGGLWWDWQWDRWGSSGVVTIEEDQVNVGEVLGGDVGLANPVMIVPDDGEQLVIEKARVGGEAW